MTDWMILQRADAADEDVARARDLAERLGGAAVVRTSGRDDVDGALASLEGRTLVVAGGDGSIHLAVERLAAAERLDGTTVGLLPCGTGNDLAHTLDLPADPSAAADVLRGGTTRHLDIASVMIDGADAGVCVNALHTGIGVRAAARAQRLKDALGDLAYPLGSLAAGAEGQTWDLRVEVDGTPVAQPSPSDGVLMVVVANGRTIGGGRPVAPDADPGDGLLDVVVSQATAALDRAGYALDLTRGEHVARDDVVVVRGRDITLTGRHPGLNVDGELWHRVERTVRVRVRPAALQIVTP